MKRDLDSLVKEVENKNNPLQGLYSLSEDYCLKKDSKISFSVKVGSWFLDKYVPLEKSNPSRHEQNVRSGLYYAVDRMLKYVKGDE